MDGRLRLAIVDSGTAFLPEAIGDGITNIRERLSALYGANASLTLRERDHGATEAVLEIPYEITQRGPGSLA